MEEAGGPEDDLATAMNGLESVPNESRKHRQAQITWGGCVQ